MLKNAVLTATRVAFASCGGSEMWIPQVNSRPAVKREYAQLLDSAHSKGTSLLTMPEQRRELAMVNSTDSKRARERGTTNSECRPSDWGTSDDSESYKKAAVCG
jgi:hypothetical protein